MKLPITLTVIVLIVLHIVSACQFTPRSVNAGSNEDNKLSCLSVREASNLGLSTCSFFVSGAESTILSGELASYNKLELSSNATIADLIMTNSYSPIIDTEDMNVVPEGIIQCEDKNGSIVTYTIIITIFEENTQTPTFNLSAYTFNDIPENFQLSADFTTLTFGPSIIATDLDNSAEGEHRSNIIIFELEQDFGKFSTIGIRIPGTTYPYVYRASISLTNSLDYITQSSYLLRLKAKNSDNSPTCTSIVDVTINVRDVDNQDPIFNDTEYRTDLTQEMLTYANTYILPTSPTIDAYDQDLGINEHLVYSIDLNCGDTEECNILYTNFRIDSTTGQLSFINYDGLWYYSMTEIRFQIVATQVDNIDKAALANVTAVFDLPPTPSPILNKCAFVHGNNNSYVDKVNKTLVCNNVHEYTDQSTAYDDLICSFGVTEATNIVLSGELTLYNDLPFINNGNGSLFFGLRMSKPYTAIVDKATPQLHPIGTVTCTDTDNTSETIPIQVHITEENTQSPIFEQETYTFLDVPENLPVGVDFATNIYGTPIHATDSDNTDIDPTLSYMIIYEVDVAHADLFEVQSIVDSQVYPKRFRASISLKKNFYPDTRFYEFQLFAKNAIPNVAGEIVSASTIHVALN